MTTLLWLWCLFDVTLELDKTLNIFNTETIRYSEGLSLNVRLNIAKHYVGAKTMTMKIAYFKEDDLFQKHFNY